MCDSNINCDNAEDEMNCTDERFYCNDLQPPYFLAQYQVMNLLDLNCLMVADQLRIRLYFM